MAHALGGLPKISASFSRGEIEFRDAQGVRSAALSALSGIDAFLRNYDVYAEWMASAGTRPPQSLIGVQRLVLPELMVEIEVEAAA